MTTFKNLVSAAALLASAAFVGSNATGCSSEPIAGGEDEHVGAADQALTAEQCNYFSVNGKVQICHRTASTTKPYTVLKISEQACVNAHALHAGDYVAVNDPNCQGTGCLPENAPCDPTLPCCDGFSCTNGTCTANVSDHCAPSPCQNGGSCVNSQSGYTCDCPAGYVGANCETEIDECVSNPCVNGQCLDGINAYECACDSGWEGANCDINIDDCAANPCVHGTCADEVDSYACTCDAGWQGANCDQEVVPEVTCPCGGMFTTIVALAAPESDLQCQHSSNPLGVKGTVAFTAGTTAADLFVNARGFYAADENGEYSNGANTCLAMDANWNYTYVSGISDAELAACLALTESACPSAPPPPTCGPGLTLCNNVCVILGLDENNCGSCGNVCPEGVICNESACQVDYGG